MDNNERFAPYEDKTVTQDPKIKWELDMAVSSMLEVKEECIEDESAWDDYTYNPEVSESIEFKSEYDSEQDVLQQLKKEFYEECQRSTCSSVDRIVFEDEILNFVDNNTQELHNNNNNNAEDEFFLNVRVKDQDVKYQVTIKTERLEDSDAPDTVEEDSCVHYDTLVTLKDVQCKWCKRIFKNSLDLFKHNLRHMKLNVNITCPNVKHKNTNSKGQVKNTKTYHCKQCNSDMQTCHRKWHIDTLHCRTEETLCGFCGKRFKCLKYLQKHMSVHTEKTTADRVECKYCNKIFKHKNNLYCHVRNCHNPQVIKCDQCDRVFNCKNYLMSHISKIHRSVGKVIKCWCGREFLNQRRLTYHRRTKHRL